MNDASIQSQIRLTAFKVVSLNLSSKPKEVLKKDQSVVFNPTSDFDLDVSNLLIRDNPNGFVKVFRIFLSMHLQFEDVHINLEFHSVFECDKVVDTAFLESQFANISAPAIGFPYVRAFLSTLTLQAGLPAITLPSINFVQFEKNQKEKAGATK